MQRPPHELIPHGIGKPLIQGQVYGGRRRIEKAAQTQAWRARRRLGQVVAVDAQDALLHAPFADYLEHWGTGAPHRPGRKQAEGPVERKSTCLNSSHGYISYAVFCLKKKHKYF